MSGVREEGTSMRKRMVAVLVAGVACMFGSSSAQAQVAVSKSYFVPQSGNSSTPTEGPAAIANFRTCPNVDGLQLLRLNARIKIVLHNAFDAAISGVAASAIYIRLTGGVGDSTVTDGPGCPGTQYLFADGPTNSFGETTITFLTAGGRWGHYDSNLAVFAQGVQLQGRLISNGTNGEYTLGIKNVDIFGGTAHDPNAKSEVSLRELNSFVNTMLIRKDPLNFWRDFDNNGIVNAIDLNFLKGHMHHNCGSPVVH
jgi:hypothetical protein